MLLAFSMHVKRQPQTASTAPLEMTNIHSTRTLLEMSIFCRYLVFPKLVSILTLITEDPIRILIVISQVGLGIVIVGVKRDVTCARMGGVRLSKDGVTRANTVRQVQI